MTFPIFFLFFFLVLYLILGYSLWPRKFASMPCRVRNRRYWIEVRTVFQHEDNNNNSPLKSLLERFLLRSEGLKSVSPTSPMSLKLFFQINVVIAWYNERGHGNIHFPLFNWPRAGLATLPGWSLPLLICDDYTYIIHTWHQVGFQLVSAVWKRSCISRERTIVYILDHVIYSM